MAAERLEEFRDFIQLPIYSHVDKYGNIPDQFVIRLTRIFGNIKGETREYLEINAQNKGLIERYIVDMIWKIEIVEKRYFIEVAGEIIYTEIDNSARYVLNKYGNPCEMFAFYIYDFCKEIKKYFASFSSASSSSKSLPVPGRKTSYPSFVVKYPEVLNDAYTQLKRFGFIPDETPKKDFVDIFSGRLIKAPIVWLKENNSLAYFIRKLIQNKAVEPLGKDHWLVTKKCFVLSKSSDYDTDSLRNSDPPIETSSLDMIIETFCTPLE